MPTSNELNLLGMYAEYKTSEREQAKLTELESKLEGKCNNITTRNAVAKLTDKLLIL